MRLFLNSETAKDLHFTCSCGHGATISTWLIGKKMAEHLIAKEEKRVCVKCRDAQQKKQNAKVNRAFGITPKEVFAGESL